MDASSRYPSPSSSFSSALQSGCASPLKLPDSLDVTEIQVRTDGPPPAKRRKVTARKPRTTEHLDLDNRDDAGEAHLDRLLHVLRTKKKIVVIAGAGISVSAGSKSMPTISGSSVHIRCFAHSQSIDTLISTSSRLSIKPRSLSNSSGQAQDQGWRQSPV